MEKMADSPEAIAVQTVVQSLLLGPELSGLMVMYRNYVLFTACQHHETHNVYVSIYPTPNEAGHQAGAGLGFVVHDADCGVLEDMPKLEPFMADAMERCLSDGGWGEYMQKLENLPPGSFAHSLFKPRLGVDPKQLN